MDTNAYVVILNLHCTQKQIDVRICIHCAP